MTEFGNMTGLSWLSMNDNDLSGTIPTEFGNLVNMTRLILTGCLLSGQIPAELGKMTKLENLSVESNALSGSAPDDICKLRNLQLNLFVTDCPFKGLGVQCDLSKCCTFCRRTAHAVSKPGGP